MQRPGLDQVPGFGLCRRCQFVSTGPAELCYSCARRTIEALAPFRDRCKVCDLPYVDVETKRCGNPICNWHDRQFSWNFAIAYRSGQLEQAINSYKFGGRRDWATVFARVLAGFLVEQRETFDNFDFITASPTFVGVGGRDFDHTREVLVRAALELPLGSQQTFDLDPDPTIVKTAATPSMTSKKHHERRSIAEGPLRAALRVQHPERTRGKHVLVYDDVFTDGMTLNEVARALRVHGGALEVCGVTLCRQPWKGGGS